jgi:membrane protein
VWLAASGGLSVYAAYFGSYEKTWGTLAAVIVTLLWLWLTSAALLFGAEVNAQVERLAAERGDAEAAAAVAASTDARELARAAVGGRRS